MRGQFSPRAACETLSSQDIMPQSSRRKTDLNRWPVGGLKTYSRRLRLEPLEQRRLLATFTVTNLDDAGSGSLRDAIVQANSEPGADEIVFEGNATSGSILLSTGELEITDTLTITGSGPELLTIDAQDSSRIFNFTASTGNFSIAGLAITRGRSTDDAEFIGGGGGIRFVSDGDIVITNSTITNNAVWGNFADGGGVFSPHGNVTLVDSSVCNNTVFYDNGGGLATVSGRVTVTRSLVCDNEAGVAVGSFFSAGGGIYTVSGDIALTDSKVSNNVARDEYDRGSGGGIYTGSGNILLRDSTISDNIAGEVFDSNGGGIHSGSGNVTLISCTVAGNKTGDEGGGIYSIWGSVAIFDSTISDNRSDHDGGGIHTTFGDVSITRSTIRGNVSLDEGGGIFVGGNVTIYDSTISANASVDEGGGIRSDIGNVSIENSTISRNNSGDHGDAIYSLSGNVTISNSTITENDTGTFRTTSVYIRSYPAGGVFTVTNSIIAGNSTHTSDQQLWLDSQLAAVSIDHSLIGNTAGTQIDERTGVGNLLNVNPVLGPLADNGGPTQTHALLLGSPAYDAGNGVISQEFDQRGEGYLRTFGNSVDMGAYEVQFVLPSPFFVTTLEDSLNYPDNEVSLREAIIAANLVAGANTIDFDPQLFVTPEVIALTEGELEITDTLTINGPGKDLLTVDAQQQSRVFHFSNASGDLSFSGLTITGGNALEDGGGIRFGSDGILTLSESSVTANVSREEGGGIASLAGAVRLMNVTVLDNRTLLSSSNGGGLFTSSGDVNLTNTVVSLNKSGDNGGGISTSSGDVFLTNSNITSNNAGDHGGGIFTNSGNVHLIASHIVSNDSRDRGGAIATFDGNVTIDDSTVDRNSSALTGGGIYASSGVVTVNRSSITNNSTRGTSLSNGGGIYTREGALFLDRSTVSGNYADSVGGGVYSSNGVVTITESTISDNTARNRGSGIYIEFVTDTQPTIATSIVASNISLSSVGDIRAPSSGSGLNINYSIVGNTNYSTITTQTGVGNLLNVDPLLAPLGDYGGATQTHALLFGSPAIDAGDPLSAFDPMEFDQRGEFPFVRVVGGRMDIGAFEVKPQIVNSSADFDDGDFYNSTTTLREAINRANSLEHVDGILFDAALSGETIFLDGNELTISNTLTIDASALSDRITIDAQGSSRVIDFSDRSGDLTLKGISLIGGLTPNSGAGIRFNSNGVLKIDNGFISGNAAGELGGGIFSATGSVELTLSEITDNSSLFDGGGIATFSGNVALTDSAVRGNSSMEDGGGIRTFGGDVSLNRSAVASNSSVQDGGGIFTLLGNVNLANSTIDGNNTGRDGGGVASLLGQVTLLSSTVIGNTSDGNGGGLYMYQGSIDVMNSTISGNSSQKEGGGIYSFGASLTAANSTVHNNATSERGGGLFVEDSSSNPAVTISNTIIAGNLALQSGSDLFVDPDSLLTVNYSLLGVADGLPAITGNTGNHLGAEGNPLDPLLAPLADNGGSVQTHALLPGSPAIDAGNHALTLKDTYDLDGDGNKTEPIPFDQRGHSFARIFDAAGEGNLLAVDIGAYEVQGVLPELPGDYNRDGMVDAADYTVWRDVLGATVPYFSLADGDGNGVISGVDYQVWRSHFGESLAEAAFAQLSPRQPESASDSAESTYPALVRRMPLAELPRPLATASASVLRARRGEIGRYASVSDNLAELLLLYAYSRLDDEGSIYASLDAAFAEHEEAERTGDDNVFEFTQFGEL